VRQPERHDVDISPPANCLGLHRISSFVDHPIAPVTDGHNEADDSDGPGESDDHDSGSRVHMDARDRAQ
jgi:hypothetical protein